MVIKKLFGKKGEDDREYTIDELIILERWEEAEEKLKAKMKVKEQVHDHLKLADVYVGLKRVSDAIEEYTYVAEKYADDGFYDRAIAAVSKARRLNPMDDTLPARQKRYERARHLEIARAEALEGFLEGQSLKEGQGTAVIEFQTIWRAVSGTAIVKRLDEEQLKLFFTAVDPVYLGSQKTVVDRGDSHEYLYLVCGGEVRAEVEQEDGSQVEMRTFGAGDIIGERALFEHEPWPATYVTRGKTILLRVDQEGVETCLKGNPDPRGFLDTLRRQRNDHEVAEAVAKFEGAG